MVQSRHVRLLTRKVDGPRPCVVQRIATAQWKAFGLRYHVQVELDADQISRSLGVAQAYTEAQALLEARVAMHARGLAGAAQAQINGGLPPECVHAGAVVVGHGTTMKQRGVTAHAMVQGHARNVGPWTDRQRTFTRTHRPLTAFATPFSATEELRGVIEEFILDSWHSGELISDVSEHLEALANGQALMVYASTGASWTSIEDLFSSATKSLVAPPQGIADRWAGISSRVGWSAWQLVRWNTQVPQIFVSRTLPAHLPLRDDNSDTSPLMTRSDRAGFGPVSTSASWARRSSPSAARSASLGSRVRCHRTQARCTAPASASAKASSTPRVGSPRPMNEGTLSRDLLARTGERLGALAGGWEADTAGATPPSPETSSTSPTGTPGIPITATTPS